MKLNDLSAGLHSRDQRRKEESKRTQQRTHKFETALLPVSLSAISGDFGDAKIIKYINPMIFIDDLLMLVILVLYRRGVRGFPKNLITFACENMYVRSQHMHGGWVRLCHICHKFVRESR